MHGILEKIYSQRLCIGGYVVYVGVLGSNSRYTLPGYCCVYVHSLQACDSLYTCKSIFASSQETYTHMYTATSKSTFRISCIWNKLAGG